MFTPIHQHTSSLYSISQLVFRGLLLLLALSLLGGRLAAQSEKDVLVLEPEKPVERELAGGQSHTYRITLTADQYLFVVDDQRGIDVVVTLFGPDGKKIK